jgi:hypothetical protein
MGLIWHWGEALFSQEPYQPFVVCMCTNNKLFTFVAQNEFYNNERTANMSRLSPIPAMRRLTINSAQLQNRLTAAAAAQPPSRRRAPLKRAVSFGEIQVLEFAPTIGDNPFVSKGASIALGMKKVREMNAPLDLYETVRQPLRRHGSRLAIKPHVRAEL